MAGPIPDSYWLEPGRLLAGEHPGGRDEQDTRTRLARFREAGVTVFLDLTEEGERAPYAPSLDGWARTIRFPLRDRSCPDSDWMTIVLDLLDELLAAGEVVYVHCFGGIGRTGTVVGCYLVRHGMSGEEALATIARLRAGTPSGWCESPETPAQRQFVLSRCGRP